MSDIWVLPKDEREFETAVERIDQLLIAAGDVPVRARELAGLAEASRVFGETLWMPTPNREPIEGCYKGPDLAVRISRWFAAAMASCLKSILVLGAR